MMPKQWIAAVILAVLVPTLAIVWHLSSWNIWEQLPASSSLRMVLNSAADASNGKAAALVQFLPIPSDIAGYVSKAQRVGYSEASTGRLLIAYPTLASLFSLPKQLVVDGWQVERQGLLVIATKGREEPAALHPMQSFFVSLGKALIGRYRGRPWALGSMTASVNPALPPSFRLRADTKSRELRIHLTQAPELPPIGPQTPLPNPEAYISLPGDAFTNVPAAQTKLWTSLLQQKLHFTHTKPDIMKLLPSFSRATVALDGTSAALAIQGDTAAFIKQATMWLQQEESHSRVVKKAFRLPDGTLGYEDVPGTIQDVLQVSATDPQCLIPQGTRTSLVICSDSSHAALATSTDFAKQFLRNPRAEWEMSLRGAFLNNLPITDVTKLTLQGSTNDLVAQLWW